MKKSHVQTVPDRCDPSHSRLFAAGRSSLETLVLHLLEQFRDLRTCSQMFAEPFIDRLPDCCSAIFMRCFVTLLI